MGQIKYNVFMLEVHVKISCFRAKAQLVFHSIWRLIIHIIQSNPAISKSQGKWKKVRNSGDFELTEFEIAGFDCKRNDWSEQAIRDVPTHEHKLAQIFASSIASRVVSINYVVALGGFICSICEWLSHLPLDFFIVFEPKKVK